MKTKKQKRQELFRLISDLYHQTPELSLAFRQVLVETAGKLEAGAGRTEDILAKIHADCVTERLTFSPNCPPLLEDLYQESQKAMNRYQFWSNLWRSFY